MPVPDGLDWELWQVVTSKRISASLTEIRTSWTIDDVYDAIDALRVWSELEDAAAKAARS